MSLVDFSNNNGIIDDNVKYNIEYNYSNLILNSEFIKTTNSYFVDKQVSPNNNISLFGYVHKDTAGIIKTAKGKYQVSRVYFSRNIHLDKVSSTHDVEMIIQNELFLDDPYNSIPENTFQIRYIYQIILFQNNNNGQVLFDMNDVVNSSKHVKIDGNKLLNIHKKNNSYPSVFFLKGTDLKTNLFSTVADNTNPMIFLWRAPITDYKINNFETVLTLCNSSTSNLAAIIDWSKIFITGVNNTINYTTAADVRRFVTNARAPPNSQNQLTISPLYTQNSVNFAYVITATTDDIYIDCSPINESVENVNFYLEKLNGTDDSTQKKMMEMIINCLIIVIVSGSVFFSAPTICERLLFLHLSIREEIFRLLLKKMTETEIQNSTGTKENDRDILFGIEFGIGFEIIIITIVLLSIGISKQKKEITIVAIVFVLIAFSFVMSITNSNVFGILKGYKVNESSFSMNALVYSIFPVPIAQAVVAVFYFSTGPPPPDEGSVKVHVKPSALPKVEEKSLLGNAFGKAADFAKDMFSKSPLSGLSSMFS